MTPGKLNNPILVLGTSHASAEQATFVVRDLLDPEDKKSFSCAEMKSEIENRFYPSGMGNKANGQGCTADTSSGRRSPPSKRPSGT
jgi:hypothetical protein